MPTFPFNETIPDAPNNPSADQPLMKQNNLSTYQIINEDHFTFEEGNNDGRHRQTRMVSQANVPLNRPVDGGTLYVKDVLTSAGNTEGTLFYAADQLAKEYQMTRTIQTFEASFGSTDGGVTNAGWTFLPGGLLLQYGAHAFPIPVTINFPVPFTGLPFSLTLTLQGTGVVGDSVSLWVDNATISSTSFRPKATLTGITTNFLYWMAIGR